jgi:phosphoenolpyruvate carboxylase
MAAVGRAQFPREVGEAERSAREKCQREVPERSAREKCQREVPGTSFGTAREDDHKAALREALFLSINGIAAAMQSTG